MRENEFNIGKSIAQLKGRFAGAKELKQKAKTKKELAKKFVPLRNKAISAWYEYQAKILTTSRLNDADVTKQEKQQMYKKWAKGMFPKTYTGKVPNMFTTKSTQEFVGKEVEEFLKTKLPKSADGPADTKIPVGTKKIGTDGNTYEWKGAQWVNKTTGRAAGKNPSALKTESIIREDKNLHLEHAEDLIFDQGYDGAVKALKYIDAVVDVLEQGQGKSKLTVKWDGAPAVFAGIDPDDGKFFVGTKGVFNTKEPKMVKSKEDLSQYGDGLAKKLGIAFEHLKDLGIGNVLQGDLLFTEDDVKLDNIGGEPHYVFTPNTITYAVPADSDLGERIAGAKMGIVFHTTYTGETRADMQAAFGADVNALTRTNSVWFDDATMKNVTGTATLTDQEQSVINKYIANVARLMETISKDEFDIITSPDVGKMLKIYMNQRVRGGQAVDNPEEFIKGFVEFYTQRLQKEIDGLKSGNESPAAQRRMEKIQRQEQFVQQNMPTLVKIVSVYKGLIDLKTMLVKKLNKLEGLAGTFIKTDNGYRVTDPEGFVAINGKEAVKLVDRLEFSKENFNAVKNWN